MKKELSANKWIKYTLFLMVTIVLLIGCFVALVDPFFHFHGPIGGLSYPLLDERYQNDGIARHYDYDAIIAGTSIAQNFKPSEVETLWGTKTIKQTAASATFYEQDGYIRRALKYRPNVKYVFRSLDLTRLNTGLKDESYEDIPNYLYDQNPLNDVRYLYNKDVILKAVAVLNYTRAGNQTMSQDLYGAWYSYATYGREQVLSGLIDYSSFKDELEMTAEDESRIRENVETNILQTAVQHPDTEFYVFVPPYSAAYWYGMVQSKQLAYTIEAEKIAIECLLEAPNIKVYDFSNHIDMTTNLDNYMDTLHYGEWINSQMLQWMHDDEGRITKGNIDTYFEQVKKLYQEYPYDYE